MASNADKKGFTHLVVLSEKEKECNGYVFNLRTLYVCRCRTVLCTECSQDN
jgi:hypothetical protein